MDYEIQQWPKLRNILELFLTGHKRHTLFGHGTVDVTKALERIKSKENADGPTLNTYLVYAIGRTAAKNEKMRTFRYKQKKIVFKHADIMIPILKTLPNGVKIPVMYVVRRADTKSLEELNTEMRNAVKSDLTQDSNVKFRRKLSQAPIFVQKLVYQWIFRHPVRVKKFFGNMGITNVRQLGYSSPFVGMAPNIYSCQFSVGNVNETFLPDENKQPTLRSVLSMGAGMDHVVMDGMCMATIAKDLCHFMETAEGLE